MTIFSKQNEAAAYSLSKINSTTKPKQLRQLPLKLPQVSELTLMRHFSQLERQNMGIDTHFYPLGSCTMKYNPRINEEAAQIAGFRQSHPQSPADHVQGNLRLIYELQQMLSEICGMDAATLLPNAGAQGEFVGVRMIAAYHQARGEAQRNEMIVPDSAHGTNPSSAVMAGFKVVTVRSDETGDVDLKHLQELVSERTAGLMITNPNTLGLFSPNILKISQIIHDAGGLLYNDGANLNAILNIARPGEMGFDVMHVNLHKTFSTPHGGGGPGSGPVLCKNHLTPFLPTPHIKFQNERYEYDNPAKSIGRIASFHGNFGVYLKAYLYIKLHGKSGLRRVSEQAVLNANYLKYHLQHTLTIPYSQPCMHEFIAQILHPKLKAYDVAKRLLDYGSHAPTTYFPLIVRECLLIEPTECESKETLDGFIAAMQSILQEDVELLQTAPHTTTHSRFDEAQAARKPILKDE